MTHEPLRDVRDPWPSATIRTATGHISDFVTDEVTTPDGQTLTREYLRHPGAVAIIAQDDEGRVAVVTQYRHPVRSRLVEPPAGLLDVAGEAPLTAAERELAEEACLAADDWRVLVDVASSPGCSSEAIRVFLARGLRPADRPDGFVVEGEEAHMDLGWARLEDLVSGIYEGRLQSPTLGLGVLALWGAQQSGSIERLRPGDAPWDVRSVVPGVR